MPSNQAERRLRLETDSAKSLVEVLIAAEDMVEAALSTTRVLLELVHLTSLAREARADRAREEEEDPAL